MKKIIFVLTFVFAVSISITSCKGKKEKEKTEIATVLYQCPMDCEKGKSYTEKGSCPVCKMDLKEKKPRITTEEEHKKEDDHGHTH